jgi:hypothetical protein
VNVNNLMTEQTIAQIQFNWTRQRQLQPNKQDKRKTIIGCLFACAFLMQAFGRFAFSASELVSCSGVGLFESFERQVKTAKPGREICKSHAQDNSKQPDKPTNHRKEDREQKQPAHQHHSQPHHPDRQDVYTCNGLTAFNLVVSNSSHSSLRPVVKESE